MNWKIKTRLFRILSGIPAGEEIYRFAQKHITRSIVATPIRVSQKMELADRYLRWLIEHGTCPEDVRSMRHVDFGAGWHPTIPIYYAMQGMRGQVLLDLFPVLRLSSFREAESLVAEISKDWHVPPLPLASLPEAPASGAGLEELLRAYGIEYHAPYMEWAEKAGEMADLVTSSQVLLHIEQPILDDCMKIIHRLMKPGSYFMAETHLFDIHANSDSSISRYNHLRFSKEYWDNKANSRLMWYNRLKARDYREVLERAGFEIADFKIIRGSEKDLKDLAEIDIHPEFLSRYSMEELSEVFLFFCARKK
ncbi:MAG: methyltransferase domain-containing protein [Verrucomicrobiales bacterium]